MNTIKPVAYYGNNRIPLSTKADGKETFSYKDLDRTKLSAFALERDKEELFRLHLEEGQRLIWRKRVYQTSTGNKYNIHILGWQKNIGGENIQSIAYVFEDGHIEMAGRFQEDHPIFNGIELTDEEQDK